MGERTIELTYEGCTIVLHKPQLTEEERAKREREAIRATSHFMAELYRRKRDEEKSN